MRLSLVFELLLIFILLAFAASRHIDSKGHNGNSRGALKRKGHRQQSPANKYCHCSTLLCNCCRDFSLPVVGIKGPGCASLQYLQGDRMAISMSFADRVLTNTTISGKKPKPVCMPLPGGVSKFCGRVYNIGRQGDDFKACLGLELRALSDIEASLRVSCFRFGPEGLKVEPPQPLPVVDADEDDDDDDDDDDDVDFDLDDDDDDDDDIELDDDDDDDETNADDLDNDVDSVDYTAFSVFGDDFFEDLFEGDSGTRRKPASKKKIVPISTTKSPIKKISKQPIRSPTKYKRRPVKSTTAIKLTSTTTPATRIITTSKTTSSVVPTSSRPVVTKRHKHRKTTTSTTTPKTTVAKSTQATTAKTTTTTMKTTTEKKSTMTSTKEAMSSTTLKNLPIIIPVETQTPIISELAVDSHDMTTTITTQGTTEMMSTDQQTKLDIQLNEGENKVDFDSLQQTTGNTPQSFEETTKQDEKLLNTDVDKTNSLTQMTTNQIVTEAYTTHTTDLPNTILQKDTDISTIGNMMSTTLSSSDDDEEDEDEGNVESMILKNEETDEEETENVEDEEDEDGESFTDAIEHAFDDDDENENDSEDLDDDEDNENSDEKDSNDKDDDSDVLGGIVDEVVNTMTGEDDDKETRITTEKTTSMPYEETTMRTSRRRFHGRYSRVMRLE